jgi:hypothetical protein
VGAIGTADKAAMGYYLVKWLSKPYALQEDMLDGMSGTIGAEMMVVNAIYFNRVERAPHWYTQSGKTTVAEVRYVLQTGLHLQPISTTNKLPMACQRQEAMQKKAVKVTFQDHEAIMEEASKHDRLEYDADDNDKSEEESESEEEIEEESESGNESKE